MALPYDHTEIEARWRRRWSDDRLHEADLDADADADADADGQGAALYNLVEFPYPSADGLHIGHALTYSGADVWGRFQRRCGRSVFQPIGFDSFGINAENSRCVSAGIHAS